MKCVHVYEVAVKRFMYNEVFSRSRSNSFLHDRPLSGCCTLCFVTVMLRIEFELDILMPGSEKIERKES